MNNPKNNPVSFVPRRIINFATLLTSRLSRRWLNLIKLGCCTIKLLDDVGRVSDHFQMGNYFFNFAFKRKTRSLNFTLIGCLSPFYEFEQNYNKQIKSHAFLFYKPKLLVLNCIYPLICRVSLNFKPLLFSLMNFHDKITI